jgi:predicted nucleic acid-binding protein
MKNRFQDKIIDFDLHTATVWGKIQAKSEMSGRKMPAIDSLIAATGLSHDLVVVTRNTRDMEISGVELLNPWE